MRTPIRDVILKTEIPNLDLIPSHIDLVGAEIEMINYPNRESVLKGILEPIRDEYDFIIIDCSPSLGFDHCKCLNCGRSVIVPVQTEFFALEGLGKLLNTIKIVQSRLNLQLVIEGILMTMYDGRLRLCNQVVSEVADILKKWFSIPSFTVIPGSVRRPALASLLYCMMPTARARSIT